MSQDMVESQHPVRETCIIREDICDTQKGTTGILRELHRQVRI
jgi:hypothetical protein